VFLSAPNSFTEFLPSTPATVQGSSVRFIIGEADFQATVGAILAAKSGGWPQADHTFNDLFLDPVD